MNIYEKIAHVRHAVQDTIGPVTEKKLIEIACHICKHHKGIRKTPLTNEEKAVFDTFVRRKISPGVAYSWVLALNFDQDLQKAMKRGDMYFHYAQREMWNRKQETFESLGKTILGDIRVVIKSLKKMSDNRLGGGV